MRRSLGAPMPEAGDGVVVAERLQHRGGDAREHPDDVRRPDPRHPPLERVDGHDRRRRGDGGEVDVARRARGVDARDGEGSGDHPRDDDAEQDGKQLERPRGVAEILREQDDQAEGQTEQPPVTRRGRHLRRVEQREADEGDGRCDDDRRDIRPEASEQPEVADDNLDGCGDDDGPLQLEERRLPRRPGRVARLHDADDREGRRQHRKGRPLNDWVAVAERRLRERRDSRDDEERADKARDHGLGHPERAREDQRHGDVRADHRQVMLDAEQHRRAERRFVVDAVGDEARTALLVAHRSVSPVCMSRTSPAGHLKSTGSERPKASGWRRA